MARHLSTFDKIKALIAGPGIIAGGAIVFSGFDTIPEEIPYYREIGIGFMAAGGLFILALFSVRARALLVGVMMAAIAGGIGYLVAFGELPIWQRGILGVMAFFIGIFAITSLAGVITGHDPATGEKE